MEGPSVPLTVRVLNDSDIHAATPTKPPARDSGSLLPATSRAKHDHIAVPRADDMDSLGRELLIRHLNDVQDLL